MDIEITDPSLLSGKNITCFPFSLPASNPHVSLKEVPNHATSSNIDISMEPSPPKVIPYSTNVPADPSLWDGNFMATSLFGTNKFINSNINNIMCSLKYIACFLRQQNVKDWDANSISQLAPFGKSAWDFVSAILKSGWDTLTTANKSSIRDNFTKEFGKTTKPSPSINICHGAHITKVPPPYSAPPFQGNFGEITGPLTKNLQQRKIPSVLCSNCVKCYKHPQDQGSLPSPTKQESSQNV